MTAQSIRDLLGLGEDAIPWLDELQALGPPSGPIELPSPMELPALPARLGVPAEQIPEIVETRPSPERDPALWWVFARCHNLLVQDVGGYGPRRGWPAMPAHLGVAGRYVYVWVFLATLAAVRRYHASRGIPDDVAWATLADLGRHVAIHRQIHGEGGLSAQNWLTLHFRGGIYELGRLQFNRGRVYYNDAALRESGATFRQGDPCLGTHIPETGPLTPEACDASFRRAREFFARHFPEESYPIATCGSWLLDPQLAEYLPATSNIMRFQRRFHLTPVSWDADREIVEFVFRRSKPQLDELPQETTLQRAIVQHLRDGRHWFGRSGWLAL